MGPYPYYNLIPPAAVREIHILLFDIDGDGAPNRGESRIVGFFHGLNNYLRDDPYHPDLRASNERLMFFMDSPLLAFREGPTWEVTDYWPMRIIGTLAHEFQHMIHFYQKSILQDVVSEAWLNEMASEVAEDLVADKIRVAGPRGIFYNDPTAGEPENVQGRLPLYNHHNNIQVTRWDGRLSNYSINYALGAYLARNYDGAALFREIVQNDRAGVAAIEEALATLGHDALFADVLTDWAAANLLSDDANAPHPYRYNSGTWFTSEVGGQTFRLGSINLFNYRYEFGAGLDRYHDGPSLYSLFQFNGAGRSSRTPTGM